MPFDIEAIYVFPITAWWIIHKYYGAVVIFLIKWCTRKPFGE